MRQGGTAMTDDRDLPAKRRDLALHDNGLRAEPLLQQSLSRLTPEQAANLSAEIAKARLELERGARQGEVDDANARKAAQLHIAAFDEMDRSGLTRHEIESTFRTGAGKMRIQSRSGSPCFVATAAYGDENHADVVYLRGFRDRRLQQSTCGRLFVAWYYRRGPMVAVAVMRAAALKRAAHASISILVRVLKFLEG
jgi:hypothetical protein